MTSASNLQAQLHYQFKQATLLRQALTHRSYSGNNNERLEFLGDSVLNFLVAHQLFCRFKHLSEGDLSRLRAQLVKESSLADIALKLNLGESLKLGEGELKSAGWCRPSILADALEALVGAVYLDGGFSAVENLVISLYGDKFDNIDPKAVDKDPKSQLQELLQGRKLPLPDYQVIAIEGEAHAQQFTVACAIANFNIKTTGTGTSRRNAEQHAAQAALEPITQALSATHE